MRSPIQRLNRAALVALILAAAPGCLPDGPHEFYRTAMQARTEYVDSFAKVVDEETAKHHVQFAQNIYEERKEEVRKGLESFKQDNAYNKLRHDDFVPGKIKVDDREAMIYAIREFAEFRKQSAQTEARLKREQARIQRLSLLYNAHRLKEQQEGRSPDIYQCPNVDKVAIPSANDGKVTEGLSLVPSGISKAMLDKLDSKLPDEVLLLASTDPKDAILVNNQAVGVLRPPSLPPLPDWAVDILRRNGVAIPEYRPE